MLGDSPDMLRTSLQGTMCLLSHAQVPEVPYSL